MHLFLTPPSSRPQTRTDGNINSSKREQRVRHSGRVNYFVPSLLQKCYGGFSGKCSTPFCNRKAEFNGRVLKLWDLHFLWFTVTNGIFSSCCNSPAYSQSQRELPIKCLLPLGKEQASSIGFTLSTLNMPLLPPCDFPFLLHFSFF